MKNQKTLFTLSLLASFTIAGCGESPNNSDVIPKNFTGDITLKCSQKTASQEMKYLFTAKATLNEGIMNSWSITQQSPYTLAMGKDFALTLTLMSDKAEFIKTRSSGHEISTGAKSSPRNTMYITDDMRTGLFTNSYRDNFYFYCSPQI